MPVHDTGHRWRRPARGRRDRERVAERARRRRGPTPRGSRRAEPGRRELARRRPEHAAPDEQQREREHHRRRKPCEIVRRAVVAAASPRTKSGRSGAIAPTAIAAGTSGVRTNGSATTAWLGVNGMAEVRSARDEHAGERLLAASEHGHSPGQRCPSRPPRRRRPCTPSSETPPCAIARRPSERLATSPVSTSACTTLRARGTVAFGQLLERAGAAWSASSAVRSPWPKSASDAAITAAAASGPCTKRRHLERQPLLGGATERLVARRAARTPRSRRGSGT